MSTDALFPTLRLLSVLALALTALSGCLVDPDKPTTREYGITLPAQLRVYQDQDRNEYVVSGLSIEGTTGSLSLYGNMFMKWTNTSVLEPFTDQLLTPLEETTVLTLNETEMGRVTRYVEQTRVDPGDGSIGSLFLLGLNNNTPDSSTWATDHAGPAYGYLPMQIFWSPLQDGGGILDTANHPHQVYMINQCDTITLDCTDTGVLELSTHQVKDTGTELINTLFGRFSAYRIDYVGTFSSLIDGHDLPDIRAHCYDGSTGSIASFSGHMYVHPEVGIIRMVNTCHTGTTTVDITAELTHTTVPLTPLN